MRSDLSSTAFDITPLLLRTATPRTPHQSIQGGYDDAMAVWTVKVGNTWKPIVEAGDDFVMEISTKTKVRQEADDEIISTDPERLSRGMAHGLPELLTKTDVQQERDDEWAPLTGLLELATKTAVEQERDDEISSSGRILELETKTEAEVEQDDETRSIL